LRHRAAEEDADRLQFTIPIGNSIEPNMVAACPPLSPTDYQRIFRVLKTVLDGADAKAARACIFFNVAGALLVEQVYKKRCQLVAGAAFYRIDDGAGTILSFADQNQNHDNLSSGKGFHCWVLCEDYIIDFMAPLFRESLQAAGIPGNCSRKMFQKPRSAMADSPLLIRKPGDFYMLPSVDLTREVLEKFFARNDAKDLADVCLHWYKKPPKEIPPQLSMVDNHGVQTDMTLSGLAITGAW
jgi:hypothetical protein